MNHKIIAVDQSTSATKAMLFSGECKLLDRLNIEHHQYYPRHGWVEHDPTEIYNNTVKAITMLMESVG
ncbi:MAG: glycerol kinase, partial [Duncaniella sp.]|nr:glycerol kinase [Duncaniella sp.]